MNNKRKKAFTSLPQITLHDQYNLFSLYGPPAHIETRARTTF